MSKTAPLPDWDVYNILQSVGVESIDELDESSAQVEQYIDTLDSQRPVTTSATFDGATYHLHQVIEESIDDDVSGLFGDDDDDSAIHWIVTGLDGGLKLMTTDFSDSQFIPSFRVDSDEYVPKYATDGSPEWGY